MPPSGAPGAPNRHHAPARRSSSTLRSLSPMDSASTDSISSPIPATTGQSSTAPRLQRPLPHQQRQAQTLSASLIQTIHTHNQNQEETAIAATASRHAAPKGGSSLVRALKARLHTAPVLRSAHLCTPRRDAGAICHSANHEEGTPKWPTPETLLAPALPISHAITIKSLPIAA
jgi:hypothetical protein